MVMDEIAEKRYHNDREDLGPENLQKKELEIKQ
jgi:hypothetical protein